MTFDRAMSRLLDIAVRMNRAVRKMQEARAACGRWPIPAAGAQPPDRTKPENPARRPVL